MFRSFRLFTLLGVPVRINSTWPIAPVLITVALGGWVDDMYSPRDGIAAAYVFAGTVAFLLAVSVLVHEFAHVLAARRLGIRSSGITLFALGGVSYLDEGDGGRPTTNIAVSLAGPLTSLALAAVFYVLHQWSFTMARAGLIELEYGYVSHVEGVGSAFLRNLGFEYLAIANLIIGLFNLLPLFPLDGGRILSAILWMINGKRARAMRMAALIGQAGAALIIIYGAYNLFFGDLLPGVWLTVIGVFLMEAAIGSSQPRSPWVVPSTHTEFPEE